MMQLRAGSPLAAVLVAVTFCGALAGDGPAAAKLKVLTTTTDLRELAREVGGDDVVVTCVTKGPEDPHFVEARPSFVKAAAEADVLVVVGMELESGYEPLFLSDSRNTKIQKGRPGYVDCSAGIAALDVPAGAVDRSMGDVHAQGNPHYLTDPVRAKQAAATIVERLAAVDPPHAEAFRKRLADFQRRVDVAMWGETLVAEQKAERLERRLADGTLLTFLEERNLRDKLGGLAAELAPFSGGKLVAYHGTMRYLLDRFHLVEIGHLEPKPGIPPSPRHLAELVARMSAESARVVIFNSYHPERTAKSVASEVRGEAVKLAHMPESVPGTATYLDTLTYNVKALATALRTTSAAK